MKTYITYFALSFKLFKSNMCKYFVKAIFLLILLINIIVISIALKFFIDKTNICNSIYLSSLIFTMLYIILEQSKDYL